jgi:hypothetical protein
MKRRWLYLLLAVSLAGNAVELGVFAFRKRLYWWSKPETYDIGGSAARWHLRAMVDSYQQRIDSMRHELTQLHLRLDWQSYQEQPDTAQVERTLDSVATLRREIYRLLLRSRLELAGVADKKARARMERRWRQQMGLDPAVRQPTRS